MMDKKMTLKQVSTALRSLDLNLMADAIDAELKARGEPKAWLVSQCGPTVCSEVFSTRAEADECADAWDYPSIEPLFAVPPAPKITNEALVQLARRCLWLAYVWNDHNFDAAHACARKTAEDVGIESFEEANTWLQALKETP
jgi:hypothetical protein